MWNPPTEYDFGASGRIDLTMWTVPCLDPELVDGILVLLKSRTPMDKPYRIHLTPGKASGRIHSEGREKETPIE